MADLLSVPALDRIACFIPPKRDIAALIFDHILGHQFRKLVLCFPGLTSVGLSTACVDTCIHSHTLDMTTTIRRNLVKSNEAYAASFDQGDLALSPAKQYLVGMSLFAIKHWASAD